MYYTLIKTTPLSKINKKDITSLNFAISSAEKSLFDSPRRLGACLLVKHQYILWGEPT